MNQNELKQKEVCQIDANNYFIGTSIAYESPLEPDIYLLPSRSIDTHPPELIEGKMARWDNRWVYDDLLKTTIDPITKAKELLLITDKYDQITTEVTSEGVPVLNELQIWRRSLLGVALGVVEGALIESTDIIKSNDLMMSVARFELSSYKEFMSDDEYTEFLEWKNQLLNCILNNSAPVSAPKFMNKFLEL